MADDWTGTLILWGLGIIGVLAFVSYVVIPYWYIFAAIALAALSIFGGSTCYRNHCEKQKAYVQTRIAEFPAKYSLDIADWMIFLNNSGNYSEDFDQTVDEYLIHREMLGDECDRLNRLAAKYYLEERAEKPTTYV